MIQLKKTLGKSCLGAPIDLFLWASTPERMTSSSLDTLVLAAFHGDEPLSYELIQHMINHRPEVEEALSSESFIGIVPIVNPDGLKANTRTNAHGVDLNRNFPTKNWISENSGTPYFSGTEAASEPETQILITLIETYQPQKILSVHTPYRVINYDGPAQSLAEAMSAACGYPAVADIGYPTPGSFGTYVGIERNIPTITLELPEDRSAPELWADLKEALILALQHPILHPSGT